MADDFFFETGFDGELQDVVCLIKSYTDTKPRSVKWADSVGADDEKMYLQNKFYLVEHRYFKELEEMVNGELVKHKVPFAKYQVLLLFYHKKEKRKPPKWGNFFF